MIIIKCPNCLSTKVVFDAHAGAASCLTCKLSDYGRLVNWIKEQQPEPMRGVLFPEHAKELFNSTES